MKTTTLGTSTPIEVSRIGLGLMGISAFYTGAGQDDADGARTILGALDRGVTFLDTAEMYGPYTNEELLGKTLAEAGRRDEVVIATKFGTIRHTTTGERGLDGTPANVLAVEGRCAAAHRPHRHLLPAPDGPRRPSRTRSARWPSSSPKARSAATACRRPRSRRSVARTRSIP
jgi:hypothetical protein